MNEKNNNVDLARYEKALKKISYAQLCENMRKINTERGYSHKGNKDVLKGVIVFTADSFDKEYSLEARK